MPIAKLSKIDLFYDIMGAENSETVLLISGLGSQMTSWSYSFCQELVDKGFRVIRFDNRDSGLSTFIEYDINDVRELIGLLQQGEYPKNSYKLMDMANDVISLLDELKVEKVHVFGRSLGGIVSQIVASDFPERVKSLTIIMSTSLNPTLPQTKAEIMGLMLRPMPSFKEELNLYLDQRLEFVEAIAGSRFPIKIEEEKENILKDLKRAPSANILGQICAMTLTSYDLNQLQKIKTPTLVVHGSEDSIFPLACGKDIANSIPNACFMEIEGMGHSLPNDLNTVVIDAFMNNNITH
ncbi:alpha/beta fold hydrolase [Pedobacter caeni]|uniref:Pimeloyl-ACP methyl ester carboxylesterase n=1 Tax=Pedobacter caeni TaxID=288992 RepID=A0A1M4WAH4_9SPHI|nr:alpha/beta hydrolase [Pedobacter caeni]SHE78219.1 Pimeloyl-ACP methyl ester carboxylesterase [Pedobacter caeni]